MSAHDYPNHDATNFSAVKPITVQITIFQVVPTFSVVDR